MEVYNVAELHLKADPFLDGYTRDFGDVTLREMTDATIVSLAIPLGNATEVDAAIKLAFGLITPAVGSSVVSKDNMRLMRLGEDLLFALFETATPDAEEHVAKALNSSAYTTDQTDVWVAFEVSGLKSRSVLERICPIDLETSRFAENQTARTSMEHLGTIIIRTGTDKFVLLSASSSAGSFLHMLETSIANVS